MGVHVVAAEGERAELAQGDAFTVPLDWDRTLARWDVGQQTGAAAGSPT